MKSILLLSVVAIIHALSDLYLNNVPLSRGFKLLGAIVGDETGAAVNEAGDVNNDGFPDVIVKSKGDTSYVIFGHESTFIFGDINFADMITGPSTGFRLSGFADNIGSPRCVSAAGDVNNDGVDDYMVGYPMNSLAYVIYGNSAVVQDLDLTSFVTSPETGFILVGENEYMAGFSLSIAGDINGDHVPDLLVTAREALNNGGITYIIFGNHSHIGDIHLESITEEGIGFRILPENENDGSGYSASDAGDVNGDGIGDIIIGAPFVDIDAANVVGTTYVIFGRNTSEPGAQPFEDIELYDFTSSATSGYRIIGAGASNRCGWSVSGLGDINGDGYDDVINSSWGVSVAQVILGRPSGGGEVYEDIQLTVWNTVHRHLGFRLVGAAEAVSGAGDVNGDGYDDILCSTKTANQLVYVVFGRFLVAPYPDITLSSMVTSDATGFRIFSATNGDKVGYSLSSARDFNNDGYDDMIVSSVLANGNAGAAYVVFGQPSSPTSQPSTQPSSQPSCQPSVLPSRQPSSQPTGTPTSQPFALPSTQPTVQPSSQPSGQPLRSPTSQPSAQPVARPSAQPSSQPSRRPLIQPSSLPSTQPSAQPSFAPSKQPSTQPSSKPSRQPHGLPSSQPSEQPRALPTSQPSGQPSAVPSAHPSRQPSSQPSRQPSLQPSDQPSLFPTTQPSDQPSRQPSAQPSYTPSRQPTGQPSSEPSKQPSVQPSRQPSAQPSSQPSTQPSIQPSAAPSRQPTSQPTGQPSHRPSVLPSAQPSTLPTVQPTRQPSVQPSGCPTRQPSKAPSGQPSSLPTRLPAAGPTSSQVHNLVDNHYRSHLDSQRDNLQDSPQDSPPTRPQ